MGQLTHCTPTLLRPSAGGTILVVDDEPDCIEVLGELLTPEHHVRVAKSGRHALDMMTLDPLPDLILLDLQMPEMDGFEVMRRLAVQPRTRDVRVIFVSALGNVDSEKTAFELGAADYITKPFRAAIVLARVQTQLELKRARDVLHKQRLSLEVAVSESHQNEAMSRELNDRLSRSLADMEAFSYTVSHDLRAPLRLVDGYAEILNEEEAGRLSQTGRLHLARIRHAARQMGQMISDILAYSRAEHSNMECIAVPLGPMVAALADELGAAYPATEVRVGLLPTIHGDPAMLRQIFANLIGNALKFSAGVGAPRVGVEARDVENGVEVLVCDNGAGFDANYAHRLFTMFSRLHGMSDFEGTGVGLAIVKRLLERHRGSIRAESLPGRETCFRVTFPTQPDRTTATRGEPRIPVSP